MRRIASQTLGAITFLAIFVQLAKAVDFERDVAPILLTHCAACHNPSEKAGNLDLLSREGALAAGDSELVAILPGNATESYVIERISAGEMPPEEKGKPLSAEQIDTLKQWIEAGAEWPAGRTLNPFEMTTDARAGKDWWSLQPPKRPELPAVNRADWPRTPIDAFVLSKLEANDLSPSPEADRATLIRRAKFDLHGLPPAPKEVREFVSDPSPDAYERLIDRLLAAPEYGERWARHWLDVARFAESTGYETNVARPNAWPYRDYVIAAFNSDMPYTQFITEQIAGDRVGADVATGFLVAGPYDQVKSPDVELTRAQRLAELDDMLSTTATAFLGLTAGCAKCHDHKFDPISQHDYYSLQAIFAGVQHGEREIRKNPEQQRQREQILEQIAALERVQQKLLLNAQPLAQVAADDTPVSKSRPPVHARRNFERFKPVHVKYVRFTVQATNQSEPCIDELEIYTAGPDPRNVALASADAVATASSVYADGTYPLHKLEHINDGQYGNSRSWISCEVGAGWVQIEFPEPTTIASIVWGRDREEVFRDRLPTSYTIEVATEPDDWHAVAGSEDRREFAAGAAEELATDEAPAEYARLEEEIESLQQQAADLAPQMAYAGTFVEPSEPTYRLHRGEPMQRREEIAPGGIDAVGMPLELAASTPEADRRMALARWLADENNPLTARVMVNRLWYYHFGQGLVKQPSDFGFQGGTPSHPELLDWLATDFMQHGWRMKHIHRLIMLSSAYRQGSEFRSDAAAVDGGNMLLWRFAPRRLEAEAIRDTILATAGSLNPVRGGVGFDLFEPNDNYVKVYIPRQSFGPEHFRRMIYMNKPRMQADGTFGAFDCPDAAQPLAKRHVSTTALQALNLLNSPFMVQQAELFAERLEREAGDAASAQVERGFWLAFSRDPEPVEQRAAEALIAAEGLPAFCRGVLNANELIYIP